MTRTERNMMPDMFEDNCGISYSIKTGYAVTDRCDLMMVYTITDCVHNTLSGILLAEYLLNEDQKAALISGKKTFIMDEDYLYTVKTEGESPELLEHFLRSFKLEGGQSAVILKVSVTRRKSVSTFDAGDCSKADSVDSETLTNLIDQGNMEGVLCQ